MRCISQLEAKVGAGAHAKCDVSPDELPAVEAALAQLKDHVMLSHVSEALLPERIISLQRDLFIVRAELLTLQHRLVAVESRDKRITIREAMRELERHMCLEAAGSATAARRLFNFNRFDKGTVAEQARLAAVVARLGLNETASSHWGT